MSRYGIFPPYFCDNSSVLLLRRLHVFILYISINYNMITVIISMFF